MSKLDTYRQAQQALPANYEAWQVFGAGLENVGRDGKSVTVPMRAPAANEVLLRIDALGLCLSDMKIINQGGNHPRLRGRDLQNDPTVLGHECAATIVAVGENWKDQFQPGQRFIVQADIYYKGIGYAFGYMIPGGLAEYAFLDERGLAGDEGCYLLPVKESTGFSEAALSEPWACVVIEDSATGVAAGIAAGATVVGVPHVGELTPHPQLTVLPSLQGLTLARLAELVDSGR